MVPFDVRNVVDVDVDVVGDGDGDEKSAQQLHIWRSTGHKCRITGIYCIGVVHVNVNVNVSDRVDLGTAGL